MANKLTALSAFVKQIKDESKAEKSPSATLKKIIDDYCLSGEFDAYLDANKHNVARYISDNGKPRASRHRASQVGKCAQQNAFKLAGAMPSAMRASRPATQARALQNGTFTHLRYAMLFDALHEQGIVRTRFAEHLWTNEKLSLSGTVDRVVEFSYQGALYVGVVDFKSIKSFYFEQLIKPQDDHVWQQHAYDLLAIYKADGWMMLYENKDTHEIKIYDSPYDEVLRHKIVRQLKDIEMYATQYIAEVPLNQRIDLPLNVDWCRYCVFEKECEQQHPDLALTQKNVGNEPEKLTEPVI